MSGTLMFAWSTGYVHSDFLFRNIEDAVASAQKHIRDADTGIKRPIHINCRYTTYGLSLEEAQRLSEILEEE